MLYVNFIFHLESPQIRASIQTASGDILKQIVINSTTGIILDDSTLKILNNSVTDESQNHLETFFVLDCNATFPVDFSYSGDGVKTI